jgi:hypothetical protein
MKMIPSCPKHVVVNYLAFFPGNCLNLAAKVVYSPPPPPKWVVFVSNTLPSKASTNETHDVSNRGGGGSGRRKPCLITR